jgi:hypothetical protein
VIHVNHASKVQPEAQGPEKQPPPVTPVMQLLEIVPYGGCLEIWILFCSCSTSEEQEKRKSKTVSKLFRTQVELPTYPAARKLVGAIGAEYNVLGP